ncbi:MAG: hypothetical protein K2M17_04450, partial [Bacilli bacterium]|nr:hypothetical protein [Bacilli bacterium]
MKKFGKKDLAALVLVVAYLLSGCKASSKTPDKGETKRSNDVAYEEIVSSLMEKYKESSFIKDYGLYSDIYPVLYVGDTGSLNDDGVLTNSFSNFTGGGMSIELYYLYLMEMYENQAYQKDENGNLIFDWSAVNGKFVKFDTTVFSHQNDETGKNFRFEDKKDGNLVFARDIRDNGKEVFNKITLQRDLSEDVHV